MRSQGTSQPLSLLENEPVRQGQSQTSTDPIWESLLLVADSQKLEAIAVNNPTKLEQHLAFIVSDLGPRATEILLDVLVIGPKATEILHKCLAKSLPEAKEQHEINNLYPKHLPFQIVHRLDISDKKERDQYIRHILSQWNKDNIESVARYRPTYLKEFLVDPSVRNARITEMLNSEVTAVIKRIGKRYFKEYLIRADQTAREDCMHAISRIRSPLLKSQAEIILYEIKASEREKEVIKAGPSLFKRPHEEDAPSNLKRMRR